MNATDEQIKKYKWGWPTVEHPIQAELRFFEPESERAPPHGIRSAWVDPTCPRSPFSKFIGNAKAVRKIGRAVFGAWENYNHVCRELAWAFVGPASAGKTTLARLLAEALKLPFIELSAGVLTNTDQVLIKINDVLTREWNMPLIFREPGRFKLPPLVCFIDEVHDLPKSTVMGLLTATENKKPYLQTPSGLFADCRNVTWAIATTHRGKLFGPFDTRFTKVALDLYTFEEVGRIIQLNYPSWDSALCQMVARFSGRIPREALAFAREMELENKIRPNKWSEIARVIAADNDIDEQGMHLCRVSILRAIGQGSMSIDNLANADGVERTVDELKKFWLPSLLARTEDQPPLMRIMAGRGCVITEAGLDELDRRGIDHKGNEAL